MITPLDRLIAAAQAIVDNFALPTPIIPHVSALRDALSYFKSTAHAQEIKLPQRWDIGMTDIIGGTRDDFRWGCDSADDGEWMKSDDVIAMLAKAGIEAKS